jgi:hypothetical protein
MEVIEHLFIGAILIVVPFVRIDQQRQRHWKQRGGNKPEPVIAPGIGGELLMRGLVRSE